MNPPFVIEFTIEELKHPSVVRADAETLRSRNAPTRFDGLDFQAFPEPVQGDRPLGVGRSGVAFDKVQEVDKSIGQSVDRETQHQSPARRLRVLRSINQLTHEPIDRLLGKPHLRRIPNIQ